MSVDLTLVPWDRLAKLAPPLTPLSDLQAAADRWAVTADVYAAAADLWEDKLVTIDTGPDDAPVVDPANPLAGAAVSSISQDGISINYAVSVRAGNSQNARLSQINQITRMVKYLRSKSKPHSPLMHSRDYNPWTGRRCCTCLDGETCDFCCDTIIVVEP